MLCNVDAVVVANALEAAQLRELYDTARTRLHAIPCGVDLDLFAPRERIAARAELGLPPDAPLVFTAARIEPLKDLGTAVCATGLLARCGIPDAHLLIAGGPVTGPSGEREMARLRAAASASGLMGGYTSSARSPRATYPATWPRPTR